MNHELEATAPAQMTRKEKAALATRALQALHEHRDASALATLFAPTLIQHDPAIADGIDGLVAFVREIARLERSGITIHRTLVDGDHVVVHSTLEAFPGTVGPQVAFDIFRLRAGLIVEHWGGQESVAPLNPSGRTQVDGATRIEELDRTESNRGLVRRFKQLVTVDLRFDLAESFIQDGRYYQHASKAGDGIARLKARISEVVTPSEKVLNPRAYYAEGNFVLCLVEAHAATGPTANYDLFRCEDGWIVEHWDVLSRIPPRADWKNDNSPY